MVVVRNTCGPQVPGLYQKTIAEDLPVNTEVVQVEATDCDRQFNLGRLSYTAIGDDSAPVSTTGCKM